MAKQSTIKAAVFDAYGTVFDVHSVIELAERFFPGQGKGLSQMWRSKQLEYMFLRSLMGRYVPHDENTEAALVYCCRQLGIACDAERRQQLMAAYLHLRPSRTPSRRSTRSPATAARSSRSAHGPCWRR